MKKYKINLEPAVTLYLGYKEVDTFISLINQMDFDRLFCLVDKNIIVQQKENNGILHALHTENQIVEEIVIETGESNKTFDSLGYVIDMLLEKGITKNSLIIAIGGGMLCNLSGMVAALIFRGIQYIEVPTTLLAATDGSLSNKQAVNGKHGKNQIGLYYAPIFVWVDTLYILSKSKDALLPAIAEGIKNCLIYDKEKLAFVMKYLSKSILNNEELLELADVLINSKNKILKTDPTERGSSVILEYGHTFGHAIEFMSKGEISHGFAIAIGMCIAGELSYNMGKIDEKSLALHYRCISPILNNHVIEIFKKLDNQDIMSAMTNDNKRKKNGIEFILLQEIGKSETILISDVSSEAIEKSIHNCKQKLCNNE